MTLLQLLLPLLCEFAPFLLRCSCNCCLARFSRGGLVRAIAHACTDTMIIRTPTSNSYLHPTIALRKAAYSGTGDQLFKRRPRMCSTANSNSEKRKVEGAGDNKVELNMEARYNTAADASASRAPILPTPCSPGCPTVSFCSSSGSSEQYVSPRNGEHGGEPAEGLPLQCDPAMAKNSTSCRERQRSRREVGIKMQPSESHARLQQHSFDPLDQHASSDPTATATQRQDYSNSTSCPLASSSHVTSPPSPSPPPPPPPRTHYQYIHSFDYRCRLAAKMRALYGTQSIPIIVEPAESHLRTPSPPARPYEPRSVIAEAPMHSTGIGGGLLARLGLQGTSAQSSSAKAASSLSLSSSTASALASPSTRSTLKCVLPYSKTVAEVILTLRDRLALDSCQSLFLSVGENNALVPGNAFLGDLYQRYHHRDGFLYLSYLLENTFG